MAKGPTERTLKKMRDEGYLSQVVEHWIPQARKRRDLYGFIDVLGINTEGEVLAVQTTSYSNVPARIRKIESDDLSDALAKVRKAGWKIEVHGWHKKNNRWACRVVDIS